MAQWIFTANSYLSLDTGRRVTAASTDSKVQLTTSNSVWVSKLGSNTAGNGSPDKPYRTLTFAINALNALNANGYLVVDGHNGEWNEDVSSSASYNKKIVGDGLLIFDGTGILNTFMHTTGVAANNSWYNITWKNYSVGIINTQSNPTITMIQCRVINSIISTIAGAGGVKTYKYCEFIKSNTTSSALLSSSLYQNCTFVECTVVRDQVNYSISSIPIKSDNIYYKCDIEWNLTAHRYSSIIDCTILFPNITVSGYTWLEGKVRYDGVSGRDLKLSGSIGALHGVGQARTTNEAYRMYRVHAISGASVNLTSIGGASGSVVGTFFTSNANEVALNTLDAGLVLERLAHNLETLRQRHYLYNTLAANTTIHNLEGVKVHADNPFVDYDGTNTVYNTTLKDTSVEKTASQVGKPIGANSEGFLIDFTTDIWTGEPPTNITVVSSPVDYVTPSSFSPNNYAKFKTNVLNWTNAALDLVDWFGTQNELNGEFWTTESNIGTTTVTVLVVGKTYWNISTGATITLAGTGRQIAANGIFVAATGETSFTGSSTVYELPLTRLTYLLRWSSMSFAVGDASPSWFRFMWGHRPQINTNDNTPTGTPIRGNGDPAFDYNNAIDLPVANYFQIEVFVRNDMLRY